MVELCHPSVTLKWFDVDAFYILFPHVMLDRKLISKLVNLHPSREGQLRGLEAALSEARDFIFRHVNSTQLFLCCS